MANTPKCPRCGSLNTKTSTDYKIKKGLGYVGEFLVGYGAGALLGDTADVLLDNVNVNLHDRAAIEFECCKCGYKWHDGEGYNPYSDDSYPDENPLLSNDANGAQSVPMDPSKPQVITTFDDMSKWLTSIQTGASPAVRQAISAQMQVIRFVQSPTLVDTTFDTLLHSLKKSLELAKNETETEGIRESFCLMIQNYVFFMDAKLQMVINSNKEEGRKLFDEAGELLSNSVKDVALLAISGANSKSIGQTVVQNLFSPENEGRIRGFFKSFFSYFKKEQIAYENRKEFYDTLQKIFSKLGESRNLIGESDIIAGTIKRYLPDMESFYITNIPEKPTLEAEIEKLQKNNKTVCIVIGALSFAWALLRVFWYWLNSRHSSAPDGWFLTQFLWTAIIIGICYGSYYFSIKEKQNKLDGLIHDVKDKVGTFFYIGRKYSEKNSTEKNQKTVSSIQPEQSIVDRIVDLKKLYDGGILTKEEFNEQVRQIRANSDVFIEAPATDDLPKEDSQGVEPSCEEQEYIEMFREYLADGEISERDRKMLDRFRSRLNLTEERVSELENAIINPQLTEVEKEYLDLYKEYAADGEISERDRRMLKKMQEKMGLSEERVKALQDSLSV